MKKEYRVIVKWCDGQQEIGRYRTIDQAHKKQLEVINQIPLSQALEEEHVTISIVRIKHRK